GMAIAARMPMIATTTRSSISVKPSRPRQGSLFWSRIPPLLSWAAGRHARSPEHGAEPKDGQVHRHHESTDDDTEKQHERGLEQGEQVRCRRVHLVVVQI